MNRLLVSALVLLLATPALSAADAAAGDTEESPLHHEMERMNDAFKDLRRALRKADAQAEVVQCVEVMLAAATKAKAMEPRVIATLPADQQEAARKDYRERMAAVVADLEALKAAVVAGKTDEADALVRKLREAKSDGHDRYIPEDQE